MKGMITTIQRFSLHDGPGIRSTVFFKGCGMRCPWCHNPETLNSGEEILFYRSKCVGCGACTLVSAACRLEDGKMNPDRESPEFTKKICDVCFSGALELCGKEVGIDEVMHEVLQDTDYYEQSGGGVTLSGGEVLMQADFAAELLKTLKEAGIQTAIESCMNASAETFEKLLPDLDLLMCDLKIADDEKHREWTSAGNTRIKENILLADQKGIPIILRTPVIPGVNNTTEDIRAIAEFASQLKHLKYYELLNFNPLGGSKYEALEKENRFKDARPLPEADLEALKDAALACVPEIRVG